MPLGLPADASFSEPSGGGRHPAPTGNLYNELLLTSPDGTPIHTSFVGAADAAKKEEGRSIVWIHGLSLSSNVWESIWRDGRWSEKYFLVSTAY
jgi:hypothetical protein